MKRRRHFGDLRSRVVPATAQRTGVWGRTPLARSITPPPSTVGVTTPADTAQRPRAMHRTRSLPPSGSAKPCSPDATPAHQRHTPAGDSHFFSDTDDGGSDDDTTSRFSDIDEHDETHARATSKGAATPAVRLSLLPTLWLWAMRGFCSDRHGACHPLPTGVTVC